MKTKILLAFIGAFIIGLIYACNTDDCKKCKIVVTENGSKVSETPAIPYCGTSLDSILNEAPTTVGNRTSQWECN